LINVGFGLDRHQPVEEIEVEVEPEEDEEQEAQADEEEIPLADAEVESPGEPAAHPDPTVHDDL
jgi:hypothetical protein